MIWANLPLGAVLGSESLSVSPQITQMTRIEQRVDNDRTDPQTYAIMGAAMEVHRALGARFLEPVYQAALEMEFGLRGLPHGREVEMPVYYKDVPLSVRYRADFVCYGEGNRG